MPMLHAPRASSDRPSLSSGPTSHDGVTGRSTVRTGGDNHNPLALMSYAMQKLNGPGQSFLHRTDNVMNVGLPFSATASDGGRCEK
ncbi:uncharacterized protein UV8b_07349 [Ustilaginoidea virens]|uniref:Uncharacterized protein n=1 Tax=Ustilaginoidea virens TaxID=1159556 RepID=A0A8E5HXG5_USTVR|nr:uncharacterized protein UV8b_07349 [Ustilaginoidea virens]QUC23108.1 hypothetical protein UV8b_07349 [Ustilaginoidea virens]